MVYEIFGIATLIGGSGASMQMLGLAAIANFIGANIGMLGVMFCSSSLLDFLQLKVPKIFISN